MSPEERDRKHADLLLDQKKAIQEVSLRRNDAHKLGLLLSRVGDLLQKQPERFFSGNESAHYDVVSTSQLADFNEHDLRKALNYDAIVDLANQIRKAQSEVKRVENALQAFQ